MEQRAAYDYDLQRWVTEPIRARELLICQLSEESELLFDEDYSKLIGRRHDELLAYEQYCRIGQEVAQMNSELAELQEAT